MYLCYHDCALEVKQTIRHNGIVIATDGMWASVQIRQVAACAGCHARSLCQSSESKEKVVVVLNTTPAKEVGDPVVVEGQLSQTRLAVLLAYVVPLVLLVSSLALGVVYYNEATACLLALLTIALYYAVLRVFSQRISRKFTFRIIN